jgi:hypothetical protein
MSGPFAAPLGYPVALSGLPGSPRSGGVYRQIGAGTFLPSRGLSL